MSVILELSTWTQFKNLCILTKNLNCQFTEDATRYDFYGPDANNLTWHTSIMKSEPRNEDQIDFEDNHKTSFNWAIGNRPYPFSTSDFDYAGDGILSTVLSEWEDNHSDAWFKIEDSGLYMNGGEMFVYDGFVKGDWAEMAIVDRDGIVLPPGTVIKSWIKKKSLRPDGTCECDTPYAGNPPVGFYIRVRYHRVDSNNRTIAANFRLHKAI